MMVLHEVECKLICLVKEAEVVIHHLLEVYSLQTVTTVTDPNIALALILDQHFHNNGLKDIKSLGYSHNKAKIYTTALGKQLVQQTVIISSLDLTLAIDILKNIPEFLTCGKNHRINLQCTKCKSTNNKKKNVVCCKLCLLCKPCSNGKGIRCQTTIIQNSLEIIHKLRNRAKHITDNECLDIEQANQAGCQDWEKEINGYAEAIKSLIEVLKTSLTEKVAEMKKYNVNFILYENKEACYSKFFSSIQKIMSMRKVFANDLELTIDCASSHKELLTLKNMDSQNSKIISTSFEKNIENMLTNELNNHAKGNLLVNVRRVNFTPSAYNREQLYTIIVIHVTSNKEDFPVCYKEAYSKESTLFRKEITKLLTKIIHDVLGDIGVKVECNDWVFKSIHVSILVSPNDDDNTRSRANRDWSLIKEVIEDTIDGRHFLFVQFLKDFGMDHCDVSVTFPCVNPGVTYQLRISVFDEVLYEDIKNMPSLQSKCIEEFKKIDFSKLESTTYNEGNVNEDDLKPIKLSVELESGTWDGGDINEDDLKPGKLQAESVLNAKKDTKVAYVRVNDIKRNYQEAQKLQLKSIACEDTSSLATDKNVAQYSQSKSNYDAALIKYQEVEKLKIQTIGYKHPSTLKTQQNIAQSLQMMGNYNEALIKYHGVEKLQIETVGYKHPSTLTTQHNIATCLQYKGNYDEALIKLREVEHLQIETIGYKHPSTLTTQHDIATCLQFMGNYNEALIKYQGVEKLQIETIGYKHPSTLKTWNNIATCLQYKGNYDEALFKLHEVEKLQIETIGYNHPSTLTTQHNIATSLQLMGNFDEALIKYQGVEKLQIETIGYKHPSTLKTQNNIATCLQSKGNYDEALFKLHKVEKLEIETIGYNHPSTLTTQHNIATCLQFMGNYDEALIKYQRVEKLQIETIGYKHPSTLTTQHNIATCLQLMGNYDEALIKYQGVEKLQIDTISYKHPSTLRIV